METISKTIVDCNFFLYLALMRCADAEVHETMSQESCVLLTVIQVKDYLFTDDDILISTVCTRSVTSRVHDTFLCNPRVLEC